MCLQLQRAAFSFFAHDKAKLAQAARRLRAPKFEPDTTRRRASIHVNVLQPQRSRSGCRSIRQHSQEVIFTGRFDFEDCREKSRQSVSRCVADPPRNASRSRRSGGHFKDLRAGSVQDDGAWSCSAASCCCLLTNGNHSSPVESSRQDPPLLLIGATSADVSSCVVLTIRLVHLDDRLVASCEQEDCNFVTPEYFALWRHHGAALIHVVNVNIR